MNRWEAFRDRFNGRRPCLDWAPSSADITVVPLGASAVEGSALAFVPGPAARDLDGLPELLRLLRDEPEAGGRALDARAEATRTDLVRAAAGPYDGVVYGVAGACEPWTTPMEYGGHFLELDRALLAGVDAFTVAYVFGGEGTYLDFVADLPASVLAWDAEATLVPVEMMRPMRTGPLCAADPDAEIELVRPAPAEFSIRSTEASHV